MLVRNSIPISASFVFYCCLIVLFFQLSLIYFNFNCYQSFCSWLSWNVICTIIFPRGLRIFSGFIECSPCAWQHSPQHGGYSPYLREYPPALWQYSPGLGIFSASMRMFPMCMTTLSWTWRIFPCLREYLPALWKHSPGTENIVFCWGNVPHCIKYFPSVIISFNILRQTVKQDNRCLAMFIVKHLKWNWISYQTMNSNVLMHSIPPQWISC